MKFLIIGSGGREHAIAWKLSMSPLVTDIFVSPGNGGTEAEAKCTNIAALDHENLVLFAKENSIDITVVGPELPLVEGLTDMFRRNGLAVIGPSKDGAQLEGSKAFSKNFMLNNGVKTGYYIEFDQYEEAVDYLSECDWPVVVKADGLAAGKGVIICKDFKEAEDALRKIMVDKIFGSAGDSVIIEEFLEGKEVSILSLVDGRTILPMLSAKDHKQIGNGNNGPNTGGMGVVAPNPWFTSEIESDFTKNILEPTLKGIQSEEWDFRGILFFGVIIAEGGAYLLEYNVRMGDPETQAILPLLNNDLAEVFQKIHYRELSDYSLEYRNESSCTVVAASGGYPGDYKKGMEITGTNELSQPLFISGAEKKEGKLLTKSGRALSVTAIADTIGEASDLAYREISKINFEGIYYRTDIGADL
ncbi:MAG: phosphoribosylamine--glycine ligase [Spirochaetia bacterium]|jgi:phosphoribosylamine--glycine ligase|nr:phosphoribosylamine--glycine ligase [Spirochaetia bacterium]